MSKGQSLQDPFLNALRREREEKENHGTSNNNSAQRRDGPN